MGLPDHADSRLDQIFTLSAQHVIIISKSIINEKNNIIIHDILFTYYLHDPGP